MSDETPGAGQNALPPREGCLVRPVVDCSGAVRLTQVAGGQYVLTSQSHNVPALAQVNKQINTAMYSLPYFFILFFFVVDFDIHVLNNGDDFVHNFVYIKKT